MKCFRLLCLILCPCLLCSCDARYYSLSSSLMIEALGIDISDGMLEISVEALKHSSLSASSEATSSGPSVLYSAKGKTIQEALQKISAKSARVQTLVQNRIIVLGQRAASEDLSALLDYFVREHSSRADMLVCLSDTTAASLINADYGEGRLAAKSLEDCLINSDSCGMSIKIELFELINSLESKTGAAFLPIIGLQSMGETQTALPLGFGVFSDAKLKLTLDQSKSAGLLWLRNKAAKRLIELRCPEGEISLLSLSCRLRISTKLKNEQPDLDISLDIPCTLTEFSSKELMPINSEIIKRAEKDAALMVTDQIKAAIDYVLLKNACDIFGLGTRLWQRHPLWYKRNIEYKDGGFEKKLSERADISIRVNITIRNIGQQILED